MNIMIHVSCVSETFLRNFHNAAYTFLKFQQIAIIRFMRDGNAVSRTRHVMPKMCGVGTYAACGA